MNESAKARFTKDLEAIAESVKVGSFSFLTPDLRKGVTRVGVSFYYDQATLNRFEGVLRELLQTHSWSDKFSEPFLEDALHDIIARVLPTRAFTEIPQRFEGLCTAYERFNSEHVVLLPLGGFEMQLDSLDIGKVVLRRMSGAASESATFQSGASVGGLRLSKEQEKMLLQGRAGQIVCAEYRAIAEARRASERAEEECSRVLELLRFTIPALFDDYLGVAIGYEWEITKTRGLILAVQPGGVGFSSQPRGKGPSVAFVLSEGTLKQMERVGFSKVASILQKEAKTLTEFEKIVLRAIHWFGTSVAQPDIENKYLNLLICLEALLNPRSNDPITNAIAEGVAFVLGSNLDERGWLKRRVKELYGIRSGLSHGGQKEILEIDLHHLREIAGRTLTWAINKTEEFRSQKDLLDWIEREKLT